MYVCTSLMLHIRHLDFRTSLGDAWLTIWIMVQPSFSSTLCIARHTQTFWVVVLARTQGPQPISTVEFVKKPSSADQLRSQLRRVQLIRGCLGLQGIRRAQAAAAAAAAAHPACRAAWIGPRSVSTSAVGGTGERRPPLGGARATAPPPCHVNEAHPSCARRRS